MGGTSRNKGKRGELDACRFLADQGFPARRGQQFKGGAGSPDVVCESLPGIHFEVKRCEALRIYDAMEQARAESGEGEVPVVLHRRNDREWVVVLRAEDFLAMVREGAAVLDDPPPEEDYDSFDPF